MSTALLFNKMLHYFTIFLGIKLMYMGDKLNGKKQGHKSVLGDDLSEQIIHTLTYVDL